MKLFIGNLSKILWWQNFDISICGRDICIQSLSTFWHCTNYTREIVRHIVLFIQLVYLYSGLVIGHVVGNPVLIIFGRVFYSLSNFYICVLPWSDKRQYVKKVHSEIWTMKEKCLAFLTENRSRAQNLVIVLLCHVLSPMSVLGVLPSTFTIFK